MAKLKDKNISDLTDWDIKELRKLRISIKNRMSSLELGNKKDLAKSHILHGLEIGDLEDLLLNVKRAEKALVS